MNFWVETFQNFLRKCFDKKWTCWSFKGELDQEFSKIYRLDGILKLLILFFGNFSDLTKKISNC